MLLSNRLIETYFLRWLHPETMLYRCVPAPYLEFDRNILFEVASSRGTNRCLPAPYLESKSKCADISNTRVPTRVCRIIHPAPRLPTCGSIVSKPIPVRRKRTLQHQPKRIGVPSLFGRNLQCELVRNVETREECHRSHACSLHAEQRHWNQW
jgi:hypothetical protein